MIEMSTVGPAAIARLASTLPRGIGLLDAPVLGSLREAELGTLKIFVGGQDALVTRWMPMLSTLGEPLHVGPLGAGAAAKLVANSTLFSVLAALAEALALAEGVGLSRESAFDVLSVTPLADQAQRRRAAVQAGEYPPRFTVSLARKDADLVAQAAASARIELPVALAARAWLVEAEAAGWGDRDYTSLIAHVLRQPASDAADD